MGILRKLMLETRSNVPERDKKDAAIAEKLKKYLENKKGGIFIYASTGSEVDTKKLIDAFLSEGRKVYCPKVLLKNSMEFFEIGSSADLAPGYYDIPEPVLDESLSFEEQIRSSAVYPDPEKGDVMIVPGVAFDEAGNRYGYGAGMYDRYLSQHNCKKIALAYECQVRTAEQLDVDERDVPMDVVITEEKIREWPERWI